MKQLKKGMVACLNCTLPCNIGEALCDDCVSLLRPLAQRCSSCLSATTPDQYCAWCQSHPDNPTICGLVYHPLIAHAILSDKRFPLGIHTPYCHALLSALISRLPLSCEFEAIVPIPCHFSKRLKRGTDPTITLAQHLASRLAIPVDTRTLKRKRLTTSQFSLPREQRLHAQKGSFVAKKSTYNAILLFDDVLTTGATIEAASAAILAANPDIQINIGCLARADK